LPINPAPQTPTLRISVKKGSSWKTGVCVV
jgi:hypothetical protein